MVGLVADFAARRLSQPKAKKSSTVRKRVMEQKSIEWGSPVFIMRAYTHCILSSTPTERKGQAAREWQEGKASRQAAR